MTRPARLSRATLCSALVVLLLAGCAHTPKPNYYVLSGPREVTNSAVRNGPPIGLGPITLPDYLDRPQIVTRASDSRLALSNEHRWAEPLAASFSRALLAHLEQALPTQHIVLHPWRSALDIARQLCAGPEAAGFNLTPTFFATPGTHGYPAPAMAFAF